MKSNNFFSDELINKRIVKELQLISPQQLLMDVQRTSKETEVVIKGRKTVENILSGKDKRIFVVLGPCSVHDIEEAKQYSRSLSELSKKVQDRIVLIMRCYFEKPRTSIGWKGLCNDPGLDGSNDINLGLRLAREFLKFNSDLGLFNATEYLSLVTPQYIGDYISWTAVGARTAESQEHRSLASGLSVPVGFKNGTRGDVDVAINGVLASRHKHSFEGTTMSNGVAIFETSGNPFTHVILRGGRLPNYDVDSIKAVQKKLRKHKLEDNVVVDCSHGNSGKDYKKQQGVFIKVIKQVVDGNRNIKGLMLESYLKPGKQKHTKKNKLKKGFSITDACLGWKETEKIILKAYDILKNARNN
jgi:3-deoxy-7-phosphoheptulonate synthase